MTKFEPASVTAEERAGTAQAIIDKWKAGHPEISAHFKSEADIHAHIESLHTGSEYFVNDIYQVAKRIEPVNFVWLSIKRHDRKPIHDWRDMQEIKNQLIGPECEAVELYPAESRLADTSNQYHVWGFQDPTFRFPFGFDTKRIVFDDSVGKSVNRKLNWKSK